MLQTPRRALSRRGVGAPSTRPALRAARPDFLRSAEAPPLPASRGRPLAGASPLARHAITLVLAYREGVGLGCSPGQKIAGATTLDVGRAGKGCPGSLTSALGFGASPPLWDP